MYILSLNISTYIVCIVCTYILSTQLKIMDVIMKANETYAFIFLTIFYHDYCYFNSYTPLFPEIIITIHQMQCFHHK